MAVVLALLAALLFAGGTVLQQKVAETASEDEALKAGFLLRLVLGRGLGHLLLEHGPAREQQRREQCENDRHG